MICGGIVLALKVAVIAQLAILAVEIAQAVATAAPTFGASLAEIPIFQQPTRTIVPVGPSGQNGGRDPA